MPKRTDIKTIMIIGSGPIVIGQACEFDYSGTQGVKAIREEGYRVVLVNSNPATIMTDPELADRTYIEPLKLEFVRKIIARERPDALLPTLGGQTALNLTLELDEAGVLKEFGVELIGASAEAIKTAEDRQKFKDAVARAGLESARSFVVTSMEQARQALEQLGVPLVIRPSRTLGGSGGAIVGSLEEFESKVRWGFEQSPIHEVLLEESLIGWKEIELEVMRDRKDNGVVVCSIENVDPMGLHTGDSVTVAPVQTLTDKEYQALRTSALRLMNEIGVDTGGSNVQFAVCPRTGRQIVIEVNPRVSRSSALASKATGFPIAKIAAKLAVGYTLDELPNDITKQTPASFEPSIDYVVVKIPRFTFEKFPGVDPVLGTQMKSVGEVMAIGRTFAEALQKACRSLEVGRKGLLGGRLKGGSGLESVLEGMRALNPERLYQVARALELGVDVDEIYSRTAYDPWFLREMRRVVEVERRLCAAGVGGVDWELLFEAKRLGTSDARAAELLGISEEDVYRLRDDLNVHPVFKTVDTCAAEFASYTPYLYSSYDAHGEAFPGRGQKIMILGGGPNRIGQGLEFDYCCVHACLALREAGFETIMVNCNPETVSTDYDTSDRLYFEPLTLEDVLEIVRCEKPFGVIVQYGGQTPLRLAADLKRRGVPIIGTSPEAIELVEDRKLFSELLTRLGLRQAESGTASTPEEARQVAAALGFPLMVRPSFVLGGRAMAVVHNQTELEGYITESVEVSFERPVLLDRFLANAVEVDVDAVADSERVLVAGIIEHIERAGIHSGDSTFMLPAQTLSPDVMREIEEATHAMARECKVLGLMNVQFAVAAGNVYVLEVNPRASRSVPFVSKVTGVPWAKVAARVMAGESLRELDQAGDYGELLRFADYQNAVRRIRYVGVKESVFPFVKFFGADTVLGPEMRSTGEVMGVERTAAGAFYRASVAAGTEIPLEGRAFVSVRDEDKEAALEVARRLRALGFEIVATGGTAAFFTGRGLEVETINKVREGSPHIVDELLGGNIDLVFNTPEGTGPLLDSKSIRSTATMLAVPLFTTVAAAQSAVQSMEQLVCGREMSVQSIQEYLTSCRLA